MTRFLLATGAFLAFVLLALATIAYNAWALGLLYAWFLVPAGFPIMPYSAFIGLMLFIALCRAKYKKMDVEDRDWLGKLLFAVLTPLTALGFGQFFLWVM